MSNNTTRSINPKAESNKALASSLLIGRSSPFPNLFTEVSVLIPTINLDPRSAAFAKYVTCPLCKISKQPFVNTTLSFFNFQVETR